MAKVFSIIGYASDIDKSYVTVALAECLSAAAKKKVLVIDVGGEAMTSGMLMGDDRLADVDEENTVAWLIRDKLDPEDRRFDFDAMVQRGVSNVRQAQTIDLLPSSSFYTISDRSNWRDSTHPTDLLRRAVKSHLEDYDVVLIDCPRKEGILTRNALYISDGYILPGGSTFNLLSGSTRVLEMPCIIAEVQKFNEEMKKNLRLYGMVVSGYVRGRRRVVEEQLLGIGAWGECIGRQSRFFHTRLWLHGRIPQDKCIPSQARSIRLSDRNGGTSAPGYSPNSPKISSVLRGGKSD